MSAHTEELFLTAEQLKAYKIKKTIFNVLIYTFLVIIALFIIIPFYYMILTSLQSYEEIQSPVIKFFPEDWDWANYTTIFTTNATRNYSIWTMYFNTIVVAVITTAGTIVTVIFAAFAFARLQFKGRELIFTLLLSTMMIPGEVFVITNYQTVTKVQSLMGVRHDNYLELILPFITSVFYTFFLRQTFRQIPNELYLAARVDGLGDFGYLWKVMIPIAKSTIITIVILSMIGTWNAFVWPSLVTKEGPMYLVSNGLSMMFSGQAEKSGADSIIGDRMAASTMITVPLLIVFICLRKYIMSGVSRSGIKG